MGLWFAFNFTVWGTPQHGRSLGPAQERELSQQKELERIQQSKVRYPCTEDQRMSDINGSLPSLVQPDCLAHLDPRQMNCHKQIKNDNRCSWNCRRLRPMWTLQRLAMDVSIHGWSPWGVTMGGHHGWSPAPKRFLCFLQGIWSQENDPQGYLLCIMTFLSGSSLHPGQ